MSKRRRSTSPDGRQTRQTSGRDAATSSLFVEAFEATLIRSQPDAVRRLAAKECEGQPGGLIRWQLDGLDDSEEIWVDR